MRKIALAAMILGMAGVLGACSMDGDGAAKTAEGTTVAHGDKPGRERSEGEGRRRGRADRYVWCREVNCRYCVQEDQFFKLMSAGYEAAAKDLGYEIQLSNVTNDQMKETELVIHIRHKESQASPSPLCPQRFLRRHLRFQAIKGSKSVWPIRPWTHTLFP